jgi:predicted Zn-dependent peptidase
VSGAEVERAIALVETGFVSALQSAGDRADRLSMFATFFGDPSLVNEQADRYSAVTAEDVNRFARDRLGEENRVSLLYVPRQPGVDDGESERSVESDEEVGAL